jgi:hypothetical protein
VQAHAQSGAREGLDTLLTTVGEDLGAISDALTAQYFRHEEQPHSLLPRRAGGRP